jgi:hypothetical protein
LNHEHLLEAENSNGRIFKKKSGFSDFFFAFCLFVLKKMTSVAESTQLIVRGSSTKNVIFLNGPNFLSE